ncbi:MAG: dUTP diphosphatase [Planctomycetota bacterium]|nr:MAG: dUTP diphosphatase [Planctomycetota bacterium]
MDPVPVRIKRLSPLAVLPEYQSPHAAGMDLHAALEDAVTIEAGEIVKIPCGFAMSLPAGYEAQIRPRSGLATKHGLSIPNAPGTVDSDYRGAVVVALINLGKKSFVVEPKMRIAQMIVAPVARAVIEEVDELDETTRGSGGFGSTGQ